MIDPRPRQRYAAAIGGTGCYFLSLVHLAEDFLSLRLDAIKAYESALLAKAIREDCYVLDPARVLALLTGYDWTVEHRPASAATAPGELEILRYGLGDAAHFVVGDGRGRVAWDPYGDSKTVREGVLASKRIARRLT